MTKRNQDFSKDILSLIRSSVSPAFPTGAENMTEQSDEIKEGE